VVDDDLPAAIGVLEDEREEAFGIAAVLFAAFEVIFSDDNGEVLVERVDLEIGVDKGSHGGFAWVVMLVLFDKAVKSTKYLVSDEEGVGRIFETLHKSDEIAVIPCVLLCNEDFDDVEFLPGGGVERVRLLSREQGGHEECETKGY
jgi:hypothetical protein